MNENNNTLILLVDDVPENINILYQTLSNQGYLFAVATNGKETFTAVESEKPDLILLDIMMPEISGFDVCKKLKQDPKTSDIPIIFLTAKNELDDKVKGFKLGAVDYITKPFEAEEVKARVATHVRLRKSEQRLIELNATKDKLFSIIGHDLRGPIGNIRDALEMIMQGVIVTDMIEEFIESMSKEAKQTYNLLENLLYWARTQQNEIEQNPENLFLNEITTNMFELLGSMADAKSIELINDTDLHHTAYADKNMIETVLRNLISNAIKFTPEFGKISVTSEMENDIINISVVDTGVGISQDDKEKLFSKSLYYTTYGTNNEKGSGLGLMLCKEFVERNKGKIRVESKIGEGSTFIVTLPSIKK